MPEPLSQSWLSLSLSREPRADYLPSAKALASRTGRRRLRFVVDGKFQCSMCDQWLPTAEFYAARGKAHGLQSRCKACFSRLKAEAYVPHPRPKKATRPPAHPRRVVADGTLECRGCKTWKPLDLFCKANWTGAASHGKRALCKECDKKRLQEWQDTHRDIVRERNRAAAIRRRANRKIEHVRGCPVWADRPLSRCICANTEVAA